MRTGGTDWVYLVGRLATIYAIRELVGGTVGYVGQTTSLKSRGRRSYAEQDHVVKWIGGRQWEYVTLEIVQLELATECEAWWVDYLRALGCVLVNRQAPGNSRAAAEPPKTPTKGKRGHGDKPSEEYLAALYDRVHLRMPKGYLDRLHAVAEATGETLPKWIVRQIEAAEAEILATRKAG